MSSLLALVVVFGASCGPSSPPPVPEAAPPAAPAAELAATSTLQPPALERVQYGDLRLLADAGVYIALDESYFAEQGIELELVTFDFGA